MRGRANDTGDGGTTGDEERWTEIETQAEKREQDDWRGQVNGKMMQASMRLGNTHSACFCRSGIAWRDYSSH